MVKPSITFALDQSDYRALTAYLCAPVKQGSQVRGLLLGSVLAVLGVIVAESGVVGSFGSFMAGVVAALLAMAGALKWLTARSQRQLAPTPDGSVLCERTITLSADGCEVQAKLWHSTSQWQGIVAVDETKDHLFLRLDTVAAYVIPKRAFVTRDALSTFAETARRFAKFAAASR